MLRSRVTNLGPDRLSKEPPLLQQASIPLTRIRNNRHTSILYSHQIQRSVYTSNTENELPSLPTHSPPLMYATGVYVYIAT